MTIIYRVKRHAVTQPLDKPYRFIALTQNQNTIVNVADFEWLNQWNWCAMWVVNTHSFYAVRKASAEEYPPYHILMAREILKCKPGEEADHHNGNTLDNRRENLRKATRFQNICNRKIQFNNTSGFKGVWWQRGKWIAMIGYKGKNIYLGRFASIKEAALIYDCAARRLYGEFAVLNFPHINSTDQRLLHVDSLIYGDAAKT